MTDKKENKKIHTLRFYPKDVERWKNNARKRGLTLTEWITRRLNQSKEI